MSSGSINDELLPDASTLGMSENETGKYNKTSCTMKTIIFRKTLLSWVYC